MSTKKITCSRFNKVGGQAVLEGVMMKAGAHTVTTCRRDDGSLFVHDGEFVSVRKKHKWMNIPILRGVINFIEMMILSVKTMNVSAEAIGLESNEPSRFEKFLKKRLGIAITDLVMVIGVVLGFALALFLFMFLPTLVSELLDKLVGGTLGTWRALVEGVAKMGIFLLYIYLIGLMPDIRRTFMYHGAEHKSIACYEAGTPLTPENAKGYTRFHPRCGTSFMFFMIMLGILVGFLIRWIFPGLGPWAYFLIRLAILPVVVGIGYEFIMFAGKHNNMFVRIVSAPGLWVQGLTTKEPTLEMLEVAIISLKCAMRDEEPEFREFYESRGWEPKPEPKPEEEGESAASLFVESKDEPLPSRKAETDGELAELTATEEK
ncbi:MAG: DUF1385 domain-containing protein [Clostridia bacterium]|nr:DUF1385 domain-containing protein [Clostridia bacterium]